MLHSLSMSTFTQELTPTQRQLRRTVLDVSYLHQYPHIGSCLGMVDIIYSIYQNKKPNDVFILSNGHAAIAYYAVLEKKHLIEKKDIDSLMIHPDCCPEKDIHVSSGSLGQGLPIAVGWALADKKRSIYCSISDGEAMEGSIWEALRIIAEERITNLCIVLNANGWGAYRKIELQSLKKQIKSLGFTVTVTNGHSAKELDEAFMLHKKYQKNSTLHFIIAKTKVEQLPFLKGQAAHYHVMSAEDYEVVKELL